MKKTSLDRELKNTKKSIKKDIKNNKKRYKKESNSFAKKFLTLCFSLGTICCIVGLFLLYGPFLGFRDWLITTAMSTMRHQYFATIFYDDEAIEKILTRNKIIEVAGMTDTSLISFNGTAYDENIVYENKYEEAVLKRNPNNNDYKIIKINNDKFNGYLAVIYDPSRIRTAVTSKIGESGEYLSDISKKNNAFVAINAGGFADAGGNGDGGTPSGTTIASGSIITQNHYKDKGGLIGFNEDNILVLDSDLSHTDGLRDAVTFGPFLIVNGKASTIVGNGGWGRAARTVIRSKSRWYCIIFSN